MPELTETTTTPSVLPGAASGCEAVDLIVPWLEVQTGDLVLYEGRMNRLTHMRPLPGVQGWVGISLLFGGLTRDISVCSVDLTAVTRYVTTEPVEPELSETERWQVEEARTMLGRWLAAHDREISTEWALADHARALLAITDQLAPHGGDRG